MRRTICRAALVVVIFTFSALCQTQTQPRPSQLKMMHLAGPVHTIASIDTVQIGDQAPRVTVRHLQTYSPEGWQTADETRDANDKVMFRDTSTYGPNGEVTEYESYRPGATPPDAVRIVETNPNNRVREILKYDAAGNLIDRAEIRVGPEGVHEQHFDTSGAQSQQIERQSVRTTNPDGSIHTRNYENGNLHGEGTYKRTADGFTADSVSETPQGTQKSLRERDQTGTRTVQTFANGNMTASAIDANGRMQVHISTYNGVENRTEIHYDDTGRDVEVDHYGPDGKLAHKQISTYVNDERGNWIRKTSEEFGTDGKRTVVNTEERTITYY